MRREAAWPPKPGRLFFVDTHIRWAYLSARLVGRFPRRRLPPERAGSTDSLTHASSTAMRKTTLLTLLLMLLSTARA